ncbi:MAG: hypothetical protein IJ189_02175 [Clostridia bacterium]|nr:hypothetical protein [Clostridia bacterium]
MFARRFIAEVKQRQPDLPCSFSFGYSMEHPQLWEAIRFLRAIGSPQAEFLQCDGMKNRDAQECEWFSKKLAEEGVKHLNFTFYGLSAYHDLFAKRKGDFDLLIRMMTAAAHAGLDISAGIPLTKENAAQVDGLIGILRKQPCEKITLFIPHEEGKGAALAPARLVEDDLLMLSSDAQRLINRSIYRPEREWVTGQGFTEETKRTIIISLREDNIERYEGMSAQNLIAEIEALDDDYYAAFPGFLELAKRYGDPSGKKLYRQRDLFHHYRRMFAQDTGIAVYDVTDERQSGSRRY